MARFKYLVTSPHTWKTLLYLIIKLPLGIIYFTVSVTMLSIALWCILRPFFEYYLDLPFMQINTVTIRTTGILTPLVMLVGLVWLLLTMHLAKGIGRLHGRLARALLLKHESAS